MPRISICYNYLLLLLLSSSYNNNYNHVNATRREETGAESGHEHAFTSPFAQHASTSSPSSSSSLDDLPANAIHKITKYLFPRPQDLQHQPIDAATKSGIKSILQSGSFHRSIALTVIKNRTIELYKSDEILKQYLPNNPDNIVLKDWIKYYKCATQPMKTPMALPVWFENVSRKFGITPRKGDLLMDDIRALNANGGFNKTVTNGYWYRIVLDYEFNRDDSADLLRLASRRNSWFLDHLLDWEPEQGPLLATTAMLREKTQDTILSSMGKRGVQRIRQLLETAGLPHSDEHLANLLHQKEFVDLFQGTSGLNYSPGYENAVYLALVDYDPWSRSLGRLYFEPGIEEQLTYYNRLLSKNDPNTPIIEYNILRALFTPITPYLPRRIPSLPRMNSFDSTSSASSIALLHMDNSFHDPIISVHDATYFQATSFSYDQWPHRLEVFRFGNTSKWSIVESSTKAYTLPSVPDTSGTVIMDIKMDTRDYFKRVEFMAPSVSHGMRRMLLDSTQSVLFRNRGEVSEEEKRRFLMSTPVVLQSGPGMWMQAKVGVEMKGRKVTIGLRDVEELERCLGR